MRRFNPFILSTVSLAAIIASPAAAQQTKSDTPPPQTQTSEQEIESNTDAQSSTNTAVNPNPTTNEAITVTGTRIRRRNLESPLPVTRNGASTWNTCRPTQGTSFCQRLIYHPATIPPLGMKSSSSRKFAKR